MANKTIPDLTAAAALDGTELYEASQAGVSVKVTGDAVRNGKVKVYCASLSQTGTDAPVATVFENTLGGTVVWTRSNIGRYLGTLINTFLSGKVFSFAIHNGEADPSGSSSEPTLFSLVRNNDNSMFLQTFANGGPVDFGDYWQDEVEVEIRVYP